MYVTKHNAVLSSREDCSQLFLVFTGIQARVRGLGPLEFLQKAGLDNRNLAIFRDPAKSGFLSGCSDTIRTFEDLLAWQREILAGMPHVKHVYSIGVSSGAVAAMLSVSHLGGECSWIFGPRIHSLRMLATTEEARAAGRGYELGLMERLMISGQTLRARLRNRLRMTARESLPPRSIWETWIADFEPMLSKLEASNSTVHNLYYAPTNPIDSMIAEYLSRRCNQVRLHVVAPPVDYPRELKRRPGWDHVLIPIMIARQELHSLFPPFSSSGTS